MQIEVFSDVVCPWCYIGKRRLEEALSRFDHADQVTVTYRSFQLDPSSPDTSDLGLEEMLAAKYGRSIEQARAMNAQVSAVATGAGLDFRLERARPANTFRAHRLIHYAADHGLADELTERLMHGYFSEGVRVGERDDLLRLAVEIGLDEAGAAEVLDSDAYAGHVHADIDLARQFGATGVPFFVFDRKYGISGAQETALFTEVLSTAWAAAQPPIAVGSKGATCDDSCAVPEQD
ncbi:MAG TPA: DsbA family oxidoreductase [Nakamurella sp.]